MELKEEKSQKEIDEKRKEIDNFKQLLKINKATNIIDILKEIIMSQNYTGIVNVIARQLKGFLDNELSPLLKQRTQIREVIQKQGLNQEEKEQKFKQIEDVSFKIESKWFSFEFITRELYLRQRFLEKNLAEKEHFENLICNQYQQAQPFEIIDGNNLSFIQGVYEQQFKEDNEKILVVSVLGPQSSGKSLLLNFLFGTQFQSAAGRCTKGVYGGLIKLKGVGKSTFKKILLLDTEGIQAAEARDDRFDKRIVFYILCVSHVVLICNKGEMNSQMSEIIKLATDAISDLRESVQQEPQVNIIMNMLPQIDEAALEQSIQAVSNSIIMGENKESLHKLFQITKQNLFILPFAFNRYGSERFIVNMPSPDFALKIEPLRNKILNKMFEEGTSTNNYTMKEWFEFASSFWEFTQQFEGITQYSTLDQKKQDRRLLQFYQDLIEAEYLKEEIKEQKQQKIKNQIEEFLDKLDYQEQQKVALVKKKLFQNIEEDFLIEQNEMEMKFMEFCKDNKINQKIIDTRIVQLRNQLKTFLTDYKNLASEIQASKLNVKSHIMTDQTFQNFINQCLQRKDRFSEEEAIEEYKNYYNKIESNYKQMIDTQGLKQDLFENIRQLYKNQYPDKNMQRNNEEVEQLNKLWDNKEKYQKVLLELISKYRFQFFYFAGSQIRPNLERILSFLKNSTKQYLIKIDKNQIQKVQNKTYFHLSKFIQQRIDFEYLFNQIYDCITYGWGGFSSKRVTDTHKLKQITSKLKQQAQYVKINCDKFNQAVENIDDTLFNIHKFWLETQNMKLNTIWCENNKTIKKNLEIFFDEVINYPHNYFHYDRNIIKIRFQMNSYETFVLLKTYREKKELKHSYYYSNRKYEQYKDHQYVITEKKYVQQKEFGKAKEFSLYSIEESIKQKSDGTNSSIKAYFSFLSDPALNQMNEKSQDIYYVRNFFFDSIDWEKVIKTIEDIVIVNLKRIEENKQDVSSQLNFYERLKQLDNTKDVEQYCKISNQIIQRIASQVYKVIQDIDQELEVFCFKISQIGFSSLHLIAQILVTVLMQKVEIIKSLALLNKFQESSKNQELLFIAKLTSNDQAQDMAHAQKISQLIFEHLKQKYSLEQQKLFQSNSNHLNSYFQKVNFIRDLEDHLLQQYKTANTQFKNVSYNDIQYTINDLIQFYVNPKQLLTKTFKESWDKNIVPEIKKCQNNYFNSVETGLKQLISVCTSLKNYMENFKSDIDSNSIFLNQKYHQTLIQNNDKSQITQNVSEDQKKGILQEAASQYFLMYLNGSWKEDSVIQLHGETFMKFKEVKLPESTNQKLSSDIIDIIRDQIHDQKLSSIHYFCSELLENIKQCLNSDHSIGEDFIIQDIQLDLKNQYVGCEEFCPLCRKQCDQAHTEDIQFRIHMCYQGHQIISFGGNKLYLTNKAIPMGCDEFQDQDEVYYKGESVKWVKFKADLKNWEFISNKGKISIVREQNKKIWNLIGTEICKYYTEKEGIEIVFQPATDQPFNLQQCKPSNQGVSTRNHYILDYLLMLDASGSMSGQPWNDLMKAVVSFLSTLVSNPLNISQSKISVIVYASSSAIVINKQVPNTSLASQIKYKGGGTCFDPPLNDAYTLMQSSYAEFDQFILCFMTDGGASHPSNAINRFNTSPQLIQKLRFQAIYFGSSSAPASLIKIANAFKGTVKAVIEAHQLAAAFNSLVPNIYN